MEPQVCRPSVLTTPRLCLSSCFWLSPIQIFDQWVEDKWSTDSYQPESCNTIPNAWSNFTCPTEYDTSAFEELENLNDPLSAYSSSSFELPSPISESSIDIEDFLDQNPLFGSWSLPGALSNNTITSTTPKNILIKEEPSPTMRMAELASYSESSECNSPRESEQGTKTRKPKQKARKPSQDRQAKSPVPSRQKAHNFIEKRYRNKLNSRIASLRDSIPSLRACNENTDGDDAMDSDAEENKIAPKLSKSVILDKAIAYIAELEKQKEELSSKNASLESYLYAVGARRQGMMKQQMRSFWKVWIFSSYIYIFRYLSNQRTN